MWVDTNIFHRWIQQKNAVSSPERPLGEISMLVSACRKIVSATSAVLCGFLFALRTYLCEHPSSSFRPLLLFSHLFLPFLLPLPFLLFSLYSFFFFPHHNRGGRFYLGTLQMIRFDQSIFRKLLSRGKSPENFFSTPSHIQMSKFISVSVEEETSLDFL